MTTRELNRDIKRLAKNIAALDSSNLDSFFKYIEEVAKPEFTRLYHASSDFKGLSKESILILLRLNLSHRFIALHHFGGKIEP